MPDNDIDFTKRGFSTRAVHAGERSAPPGYQSTVSPLYLSNSFSYKNAEQLDLALGGAEGAFAYTRHGNPTVHNLELAIAELEGAEGAVVFASGMAALHAAVLNEVKSGSQIVAASDLYGATRGMLNTIFESLGVGTHFVDIFDLEALAETVERHKPKVLLFESISNPLLRVANMEAIVEIAHRNRATVICDNTFATPCLINPLRFGVDVVVHSTTKYLSGHGDVTGGAVAADLDRIFELTELTKLAGGILGPFEAWLTLRGIKTLPLRMRQQCRNAQEIADFLQGHPRVATVYYPGCEDLNGRECVFNSDLRGAMVSFDIQEGGRDCAYRFLDALQLCIPATTLGDVYTLALYPPMSSHRGLDSEDLTAMGIGQGLIRLSLGIEDADDIIRDLDQALIAALPDFEVTYEVLECDQEFRIGH